MVRERRRSRHTAAARRRALAFSSVLIIDTVLASRLDPLWRLVVVGSDDNDNRRSRGDRIRGGAAAGGARRSDSELLRFLGIVLSVYQSFSLEDRRYPPLASTVDANRYTERGRDAIGSGEDFYKPQGGAEGQRKDTAPWQDDYARYPPSPAANGNGEIAVPGPSFFDRQAPPALPDYGWEEEPMQSDSLYPDENQTRWDMQPTPIALGDESEVEGGFMRSLTRTRGDAEEYGVEQERARKSRTKPVVYQYFGRSLRRSHRTDSIPFVVLGPCVDHWRAAGRILSSRGFNVMACQLIPENGKEAETLEDRTEKPVREGEGETLVLKVLDALRWPRAVVVGCDREAALAIDAALRLAPERVFGVVLCGDMTAAELYVRNLKAADIFPELSDPPLSAVDLFVRKYLDCPCTIVWDGDLYSLPAFDKKKISNPSVYLEEFRKSGHRNLIVGGGSSPHRRLPDQFAWVLTRFVEEQVATYIRDMEEEEFSQSEEEYDDGSFEIEGLSASTSDKTLRDDFALVNPFRDHGPIDQFFSSGSFLVVGRYVARMLLYFSIFKVTLHQYQNLKTGISAIQTSVITVSSWQKKGRDFLLNFFFCDWVKKNLYPPNLIRRFFMSDESNSDREPSLLEPDILFQSNRTDEAELQPEEEDRPEEEEKEEPHEDESDEEVEDEPQQESGEEAKDESEQESDEEAKDESHQESDEAKDESQQEDEYQRKEILPWYDRLFIDQRLLLDGIVT